MNEITEQLYVDNSILKRKNTELKAIINTRKKQAFGKRMILKGIKIVIKEYIYQALEKAESVTRKGNEGRERKEEYK